MVADYKPELPAGVTLPPGFSVNTADPRYVALREMATREKLSQSAFSSILGAEASRINSEYERARAAPPAAPAPATRAAVPEGWGKMSFQEKMHWSHEQNAAKRRGV
jgi:hypothetical protein